MRRNQPEPELVPYGAHLQRVREARGLSRYRASWMIDRPPGNEWLRHIEEGRIAPTLITLVRLARVYGCRVRDLLPESEPPHEPA